MKVAKYHTSAIIVILIFFSCSNRRIQTGINPYELSQDIILLDRDNPVNSLRDLAGFFHGKTVYIDRWATWCSPCIEEFKYSDKLHKFLRDNNIEMVYLNSDSDLQDSLLYNFIVSHKLEGYHLRLNDSLKKNLSDMKVFIPIIPQYMIMDKNGNIVENKALRPSKGDTLFNQLKKYMK